MRDLQGCAAVADAPAVGGVPDVAVAVAYPAHRGNAAPIQINRIRTTARFAHIARAVIINGVNGDGIAAFFGAQIRTADEIGIRAFAAAHIVAACAAGDGVIAALGIYPVITRAAINGVVVAATGGSLLILIAVQADTLLQHNTSLAEIHVCPFFFRLIAGNTFFPGKIDGKGEADSDIVWNIRFPVKFFRFIHSRTDGREIIGVAKNNIAGCTAGNGVVTLTTKEQIFPVAAMNGVVIELTANPVTTPVILVETHRDCIGI